METISIPSPTAFLAPSPKLSPTKDPAPPTTNASANAKPPTPPAQGKRKAPSTNNKTTENKAARKDDPPTSAPAAPPVVKPKQSKSRNGCITCKNKRLKCDETKPTCQQCTKRNVPCGGYKKDFKWRPFEEANFQEKGKAALPSRTKQNPEPSIPVGRPPPPPPLPLPLPTEAPVTSPAHSDGGSGGTPEAEPEQNMHLHDTFFNAAFPSPNFSGQPSSYSDQPFNTSNMIFDMSTPPYLRDQPRPPVSRNFEPNSVTSSLSSLFEDMTNITPTHSRSSLSGQSPRLIDLLLPGSELNARPTQQEMMHQMQMDNFFSLPDNMFQDHQPLDPDVEEIVRRRPMSSEGDLWQLLRSPASSQMSPRHDRSRSVSRSPGSRSPGNRSPSGSHNDPFNQIYQQPTVQAGSPEMLMLRFDKQTCGILSVKDGPTENPWRTLIWPLAHDSPALYHAIASMTAFHMSKEKPALRVEGMEHMRRSIRSLARSIDTMRPDTALATTLVLAFSESWDQHISTGIEHLRGAKIIVTQALLRHKENRLRGNDLARLKFLCNTFIYMDVIARLTTVEADESNDFETVNMDFTTHYGPFTNLSADVDPLMGCASTLFPLIGRAANLCRRVRMMESNGIKVISQAIELKEQIENWKPASSFERPEDPSTEIQHALQTAEAYRWATLLYLHQAVPECPSLSSAEMAKKVLVFLATVPLSSRLVIVQIYPLLAAGAEMVDKEDREWIEERWGSMIRRMWIGNIDRCWEVVREVWKRRDAFYAQRAQRAQRARPHSNQHHNTNSNQGNRVHSMERGMDRERQRDPRFEDEMGINDLFSFEELLNGGTSGTNSPSGLGSGMSMLGGNNHGLPLQNHAQQKQRPRMGSMPMPMSAGREHGMPASSMGMGMSAPNAMVPHPGSQNQAQAQRRKSEAPGTEELEPEFTVRGRLHWVGVMADWGWEVLLG